MPVCQANTKSALTHHLRGGQQVRFAYVIFVHRGGTMGQPWTRLAARVST